MQLRNIGDSIDHRMVQEVRLQFPQQGPVMEEEKANKTMAAQWLGCPGISETHGLILSDDQMLDLKVVNLSQNQYLISHLLLKLWSAV